MPQVLSAVKAIIIKDGTFLCLQTPLFEGRMWDLPGGKIEYGEDPEHALIREVQEETSLAIQIQQSIGVWWFFAKNQDQVVCHTFLCTLEHDTNIDFTKNPTKENFLSYAWLTPAEVLHIPGMNWPESFQKIVKSLPIFSETP